MGKTLAGIERQIRNIKDRLQQIDEMRPGCLSRQYHFLPKDRKYAYYQISYTYNMKSHTDYVRKEFLEETKKQIRNYKIFKSLTKRWAYLSILHAKLKIEFASKKM